MKTIVGLYDDLDAAARVLGDLDRAGLRGDFTMMGGATAKAAAGLSGYNRSGEGFGSTYGVDYDAPANRVATLSRAGVPHDDAQVYAEGVRRGGVLLVGRVDDSRCQEALDIVERQRPVGVAERHRLYRESGWTGYDSTASDYDEAMAAEERARYGTGLGAAATGLRDVNTMPGGSASDRAAPAPGEPTTGSRDGKR